MYFYHNLKLFNEKEFIVVVKVIQMNFLCGRSCARQLSIAVTKYLRGTTYKEKRLIFDLWFQSMVS
jgi:hypothetical protein